MVPHISDCTPEELLNQQEDFQGPLAPSALERFRTELAEALGESVTEENVFIFGAVEVAERVVDVTYAVRLESGDYLRSSYLNGILITNKQQVKQLYSKDNGCPNTTYFSSTVVTEY